MFSFRRVLLLSGLSLYCSQSSAIDVVTTIKPLHSLVTQLTTGVSEPDYLIKQGSPHGYTLKPNDIKAINEAELLVWVGSDMETFVPDLLKKSGDSLHSLAWSDIDGLSLLKTRRGGLWGHEHDDHEHDDHEHDDHEHDHHEHDHHEHDHHEHDHHEHDHHEHDHHEHDHHEHDHHEHDHHEHDHHEHDHHEHDHHEHDHHEHDHHHGEYDQHLWLSVDNAKVLLKALSAKLIELDPVNKRAYQDNLQTALAKLAALDDEIRRSLLPLSSQPYMVFHDAYQYFEHEYDLASIGAVRVSPQHEPGAERIGQLRRVMEAHKVECLFAEPQFPAKMAEKLVEGTKVKLGVLDPIGASIAAGEDAYAAILRGLVVELQTCLR